VCALEIEKKTRWKSHLLEINERRGGHVAQKIKKLVPERRGEENLPCEDCQRAKKNQIQSTKFRRKSEKKGKRKRKKSG
tara:strand:+ start:1077 stop:1313 length:237 start_codon:yes stop_codon:yes gene_type:complete